MICKGRARQNGQQLGQYLTQNARKVNDRVQVLEVRGTSSQDAQKALLEMSLAAELTKGKNGLYHASINPDESQAQGMTEAQFLRAADIMEEELKFAGQNRVIVLHEKHGRTHGHVVWQMEKSGKLLSTSKNYAAHDRARGRIEIELSHERTAQPQNIKKDLAQAWADSKTGAEFVAKAKAKGYAIGQGYTTDKGGQRPFCVVDKDDKKHDLVRQLPGIKTAEVKGRLKDIEAQLPKESELSRQKRINDRQNEQIRREQAPERERVFASEKENLQNKAQPSKLAREAGQTFAEVVTPTPEPEKTKMHQVAKEAGQAFAEVVTPKQPAPQEPEPQKELSQKEKFAQSLADLRAKQSQAKERTQQAQENKTTIEKDTRETDTQRRIRLARENLQRDNFGREHEI